MLVECEPSRAPAELTDLRMDTTENTGVGWEAQLLWGRGRAA